jgi:photosystem II stability/assembly factor-like uncharacterized protein
MNNRGTKLAVLGCLFLALAGGYFLSLRGTSRTTPVSSADQPQANRISSKIERIANSPCTGKQRNVEVQFINEKEGRLICDTSLWHTLDGGVSWKKLWESTNPHSLPNIFFNNSSTGWSWTPSELNRTEDGGYSWRAVSPPMAQGRIISVYFKDEKRGWVAGSVDQYFPPGKPSLMHPGRSSPEEEETTVPAIFYTENAGQTWQQQLLSRDLDSVAHNLRDFNGKMWVAAGSKLFYLEDDTWKQVDYQKGNCSNKGLLAATGAGDEYADRVAPIGFHFSDSKHGWLIFPNGFVAKSNDGGSTWCDLFNLNNSQDIASQCFTKVYFKDPQQGYALSSTGHLYSSKDGGASWVKIDSNVKFDDMYFHDASRGWLISQEGLYHINFN